MLYKSDEIIYDDRHTRFFDDPFLLIKWFWNNMHALRKR